MLAAIVDTAALWKIVLVVMLGGVGVTAVFGQGVLGAERLAEARERGETGAVIANAFVVGLVAIVCLAAVVAGLVAMTHKS